MTRDSSIFVFLVFLSFAAFFVVHPFTMVGGDEGRFAQDALRIGRGETPIADYGTRAPILSWFIYASTELFGRSLLAFRSPVIIFSSLTTGVLFLLGKELFSRNVGICAALLFALIPFTLYNNVVIKTEALATLLTCAAAFCLIKGLHAEDSQKWRWLFYAGIAMGIAYVERTTAVIFMFTSALAVCWYAFRLSGRFNQKVIADVCGQGVALMAGVIIGFLPVFLYIGFHNWDRAISMWLSYEPIKLGASTKEVEYANSVSSVYGFLRSWALSFVENLAVQAGLLFIGFVIFLMGVVQMIFPTRDTIRKIMLVSMAFILFGSFAYHALNIYRIGTFRPDVFLFLFIFSLPVFSIFWFYEIRENRLKDFFIKNRDAVLFICFWIGVHIIAFSLYIPGYMREMVPQLSLAAGALFAVFPWQTVNKMTIAVLFVSLGGLWGVSASWFADPVIGWWWRQGSINETAAFLAEHTAPGERVFAANPLPVILAERHTVADITSYAMVFVKNPDERHSTFPSPHEMLALLEANPPRYTVIDGRMESHFFRAHPFFEEFVKSNYKQVAVFGTGRRRDWTEVWELKK